MTSQDHRHQRRLDDERSVDALLAETGFQDDAELRDVLLQIRGLRTLGVPPPSAGLAALMDQDASPGDVVRPLAPAARKRNRAVFTSLAVAASLGIAGGAAAGNESLRHGAEGTISSVVGWLLAPAPTEPPPPAPPEAPAAPAAVVPSPDGATPTARVHGTPVPAPVPAPVPVQTLDPGDSGAGQPHEAPEMVDRAPDKPADHAPVSPPAAPVEGANGSEAQGSRPAVVPPAGQNRAGGAESGTEGKAKGDTESGRHNVPGPPNPAGPPSQGQ